jgi:hypothetical protein
MLLQTKFQALPTFLVYFVLVKGYLVGIHVIGPEGTSLGKNP